MRQLIPAAALLLLAACGGADEPALTADETPIPVEPDGGIGDGAPPPQADATGEGIPQALQGRWGLTAADCEPGRSDAKGLLVISSDKLEFYESVGTLGETADRAAQSLRAQFSFTGEGMNWTRDVQLALEGDNTLVRREFGADAAPDAFRYTKCS